MSAYLSPIGGAGSQFFDNQGRVLSGGKLYTYSAGSSTPAATWTDYLQSTSNANPVILNSAGRPPNEIWLASGQNNYKFVLTDADGVVLGSWDNVGGMGAAGGGGGANSSEWVANGLLVTYLGPTQFSVPGDQRTIYAVNRRVQFFLSSGTSHGYVNTVVYDGSGITTVTITPDAASLDSTVSAVNQSVLNSINVSVPQQYLQQGQDITANTITATTGNFTNFSSSNVTITGGSISGIDGFSTPDFLLKSQGVI